MAIETNELIWRLSAVRSSDASNGGRMSTVQIVSGVKNNVWPDVSSAQRLAGMNLYRKIGLHVANDDDLTLVAPKFFMETFSPGSDSIVWFPGTLTNTQADLTGTERKYGAGALNANVTAGAGSITVLTEGADLNYFRDGDVIRISNKASVNAEAGFEEFHTINGVPSYAGNVATITLTGTLTNSYPAAGATKVASVYLAPDIATSVTNYSKTSVAGIINQNDFPVLGDNIGTILQTWMGEFTSSTAYTLTGNTVGFVGSGNRGSLFTPLHPTYIKPYCVIPSEFFSGTWAIGDTFSFTTNPAQFMLWMHQVIPPAAASLDGNRVVMAVIGESSGS